LTKHILSFDLDGVFFFLNFFFFWGLNLKAKPNVGLVFIFNFYLWGDVMAGFVSVLGGSRNAGIIARSLPGGWVWARRSLPGGSGWSPAPACLFIPFGSFALASVFARSVSALGWRCWLRPGAVGSPVWSACGFQPPRFAVKIALPLGLSCSAARSLLPVVPSLSSLAVLGV